MHTSDTLHFLPYDCFPANCDTHVMPIEVTPLGAGQDVGRSCILVTINGRHIMLDCGMHMGYNDHRRFPDFNFLAPGGNGLDDLISAVIISHFHLDHCGALPYLTEVIGYNGPLYMTFPTKAIAPILLEDYYRITIEKKGSNMFDPISGRKIFFSADDIRICMRKVREVTLKQTVLIDDDIEIKAYYAGHVLGAAMFYIRSRSTGESLVYTGDYNMTADRHLGAARIDRLHPDLLITETTYATTVREPKRAREKNFLLEVRNCVLNGGKVLIPVFALGRAQELLILLETFWERMDMEHVPIYFSAGLVEKANMYYKLFLSWTSQQMKRSISHRRNPFDFAHIKTFDRSLVDAPGPMIVFATPGMLHSGMSLFIFSAWAADPRNLVIIPGYCVPGTVGHAVLTQRARTVEIGGNTVPVNCTVTYMSFSAHADAKGIFTLIDQLAPKKLLLVHGEKEKMKFMKDHLLKEVGLEAFMPGNGETAVIETFPQVPCRVDAELASWRREKGSKSHAVGIGKDIAVVMDKLTKKIDVLSLDSVANAVTPTYFFTEYTHSLPAFASKLGSTALDASIISSEMQRQTSALAAHLQDNFDDSLELSVDIDKGYIGIVDGDMFSAQCVLYTNRRETASKCLYDPRIVVKMRPEIAAKASDVVKCIRRFAETFS